MCNITDPDGPSAAVNPDSCCSGMFWGRWKITSSSTSFSVSELWSTKQPEQEEEGSSFLLLPPAVTACRPAADSPPPVGTQVCVDESPLTCGLHAECLGVHLSSSAPLTLKDGPALLFSFSRLQFPLFFFIFILFAFAHVAHPASSV